MAFAVQIFEGKTDAVLPRESIRTKFSRIKYERSPNHWSNHDIQVRIMKQVWERALRLYMDKYNCEEDQAIEECIAVHFLDCWNVNLTSEFREAIEESCPGLLILYVPANYTGKGNVRPVVLCQNSNLSGPRDFYY